MDSNKFLKDSTEHEENFNKNKNIYLKNMDTGAYMANQMDEQIENGIKMYDVFNEWLYESCSLKSKDPHNLFPTVDLTDAKLSFLEGMSAEEYSKTI